MNTAIRAIKTLVIIICSVCIFMVNVIFLPSSASAQSTCVSHLNGTPQTATVYMMQLVAQEASAITDNAGNDVDHDSDVIRYEYHLEIDAALASQLSSATEACLIFTTHSNLTQSGAGLSEYATTLKIGHRPVNTSSYQTFAQIIDERSSAIGDIGSETIQYAISLNLAGIVVTDGDRLGIAIDGISMADSRLGPPEQYAAANLDWEIWDAQIYQPKLVTY